MAEPYPLTPRPEGTLVPPSTEELGPLTTRAMAQDKVPEAPKQAWKSVEERLGPLVAPTEEEQDKAVRDNWAIRGQQVNIQQLFKPSLLPSLTEREIKRQMQDTPNWTDAKKKHTAATRDWFYKTIQNKDSQEYRRTSDKAYMDALGATLLREEINAESNGARHDWYDARIRYDNVAKLAYISYLRDNREEASNIRSILRPKMTWKEKGAVLVDGVGMYLANTPMAKLGGLAWGRIKSIPEGAAKASEAYGSQIKTAQVGLARAALDYKEGKAYDAKKVALFLEQDVKDPDFYLGGGKGNTAFARMLKELTPTEQVAVILGMEHKVVNDPKEGVRPFNPRIDDPNSARPMTFDDFDLSLMDRDKGIDEQDLVANDDYAFLGMGSSSQGAGYAMAMMQMKKYEERNLRRSERVAKGKIDPARWFSDNKGKGLLSEVFSLQEGSAIMLGGMAYNWYAGTKEQVVNAVPDFFTPFFYNHRPDSFWWDVKTFVGGNMNIYEEMAFLDSSMDKDKLSMDLMEGKYTSTSDVLTDPFLSNENEQRLRLFRQNWGIGTTAAAGTYGVVRFDPAMAAGKIANLSGSAIRANRFVQRAEKAGLITEKGLTKFVKGVEIGQDVVLSAPVRAAGWVVGKTGTAIAYMPAAMAEGVTRLGVRIGKATKLLDNTADASKAVRRVLYTLGYTDAFFLSGYSTKLAFAFGFGKAAEGYGHLIGKYVDFRLDGYGFRGAMAHAANNTSLNTLARSTARVVSEGGIFTKVAWDTAKGVYAGAGVGFSMAWMNGNLHDGFQGAIMGSGMAGAGSVHAGGANYLSGRTHHDIARKMLDEQGKNMDDETRKSLEGRLNQAEAEEDYEFAPRLMSSIEKLNKLGVTTVIATTEALKNNAMLRASELLNLDAADMTITLNGETRTYDINGKTALVNDLKEQIKLAKASGEMVKANELSRKLSEAETARISEINDYLQAVRKSDNDELQARVGNGQMFNGVYRVEDDGKQFVFLNINEMDSTTSSHETFHAIQRLVGSTMAARHFSSVAMGIKFGTVDANGQRGESVFQKGLFDTDDLLEYGSVYYRRLHMKDNAKYERKVNALKTAVEEMKLLGEKGVISSNSERILKSVSEELGAEWFENFVSRKPQDLLYFGGKYGKLRQLSDRMVMYMRHNTVVDANAAGIKANLRRTNQEIQRYSAEKQKLDAMRGKITMSMIEVRSKILKYAIENNISEEKARKKLLIFDSEFKFKLEAIEKFQEAEDANYFGGHGIFTNAQGTHLVVEEMDRYFQDILSATSDKPISINLDLSSMSGPMLESHLKSLGLEHYGYKDTSGVTRMKDRKQIDAEERERGKRTAEVLDTIPPERSGVVKTTDKDGNIRYVGTLTDEALTILTQTEFDFGGSKHRLMPAGVALKVQNLRDAIKSGTNAENSDFNVLQCLYSGLSKENEDGSRTRKPSGFVEQTYRRILPYRMELVMTTKDRNGNKIEPQFEMMVTAVDLGVVYRRMADEFNSSYTLPSGKVIKVSDIFGGDMNVFHQMFQTYLHNISKAVDAQPSAEVFGGGERGAAIRDIMYRVLGTIPAGGHDFNGKPLAYNNPIIRPFNTWERGPDFPFTTFRVDLMSHLEQIPERVTFNEDYGYSRAIGNYQPPSLKSSVTLSDGKSILHDYEGHVDPTTNQRKIPKKRGGENASYQILEGNGKFVVSSIQLSAPITFNNKKEAEDFINLDYQRAVTVFQSSKNMPVTYKQNGVIVGSFGGRYMLLNNYSGSPDKNKVVSGVTFSTFAEAIKAAAVLHNKNALETLAKSTSIDQSTKDLIRNQVQEALKASYAEALPIRLEINDDGTVKYEAVTKFDDNGDEVPVVYKASDNAVRAGLAKVGDPKFAVAMQKVDYALTKGMVGVSNLREGDPRMVAAGKVLGKHLVKFMLENVNDPDVMKGFRWYMDFSERGYKAFGSLFPMMCEAIGATSSRTPVEPNFKQAAEFIRKFSLGHYDEKIGKIVSRLEALHKQVGEEAVGGQTLNRFYLEAHRQKCLENLLGGDLHIKLGTPKLTHNQFMEAVQSGRISQDVYNAAMNFAEQKRLEGKIELTDKDKRDVVHAAEMKILGMKDTVLLRDNDKKFNMNSNKVTMVAVAHFFGKSVGPKTPQFARNLMGTNFEATIDVWAARTLHRILNTKILKNKNWRILPSMEMPVDGEILREGTVDMPLISGRGDFFLGQEAFRQAVEVLSKKHGDKFDGFKNLTPANLQALLWFAEKRLYEKNGWTNVAGASMSSFESPLDRMFGPVDESGQTTGPSLRRVLFGVSTENNTVRNFTVGIGYDGKPIVLKSPVSYRRMPTPLVFTKEVAAQIVKEFGQNLIGLTVLPTSGGYAGAMEDSVYIHVSLEQGSQIKLSNEVADVDNKILNAENLILEKTKLREKANAGDAAKLTGEIETKTREIKALREQKAKLGKQIAGDMTSSKNQNQLPRLAEMVIRMGKQFNQSDVLMHEVVGKNHPNARPMRTVQFNREINGFEAAEIINRYNANGFFAFTLEPSPRNPNTSKIDQIGRQIEGYEKALRSLRSDESTRDKREELMKKIDDAKAQIMGLQRYGSMFTASVPEFTWRYGKDDSASYTEHSKTFTADWARQTMAEWEASFSAAHDGLGAFDADYDKRLSEWSKRQKARKGKDDAEDPKPTRLEFSVVRVGSDYVSTTAVSNGGYDYYNIADAGQNLTLEHHLKRYQDEIIRVEATEKSVRESGNAVGPNVPPAGDPASRVRNAEGGREGVQQGGPAADAGTVRGTDASANRGRLPQEQAVEWISTRKGMGVRLEAGFMYGDANLNVLQVSDAAGKLTSEFRVHELGGTMVKFKTSKEAEAYVLGRLTGTVAPKHEPRKVAFNGKLYDMVAGIHAIPDTAGTPDTPLRTDANKGIFSPDEDIFGFNVKVDDESFQPSRITPDEDSEYLRVVQAGDLQSARKMVIMAMKRSEYRGIYYRGTRKNERKYWKRLNDKKGRIGEDKFAAMWAFSSREKAENWAEARIPARSRDVLPLAIRGERFDASNPESVERIQKIFDKDMRVLDNKIADFQGDKDPERLKELIEEKKEITSDWELIRKHSNYGLFENPVGRYGDGKEPWIIRSLKKAGFTHYAEQEGDKDISWFPLNQFGILRSRDAKLMDPVTYAEDGSVVPLSMRFDPSKDDINYQPRRFEPRRQKNAFGTKKFKEVFPNTMGSAGNSGMFKYGVQILSPQEAYSDRVEQHLTALQEFIDRAIGSGKVKVNVELMNKDVNDEFSGALSITLSSMDNSARTKLANVSGYYYPTKVGGHVAYGSAITEGTVINGDGSVGYRHVVSDLANALQIVGLDYDDTVKLREAAMGKDTSNADEFIRTSGFEDLVKGLGSLAYQEIAARLHAAGTGRREDTSMGLHGGVVNRTGSLFGSRERSFGKGNTEYRVEASYHDVHEIIFGFVDAYRKANLPEVHLNAAVNGFLMSGTVPDKVFDQMSGSRYQQIMKSKGFFADFARTGLVFGRDLSIEGIRFNRSPSDGAEPRRTLFTKQRKAAEFLRRYAGSVDTRSFIDENAAYQSINWDKHTRNKERDERFLGYSRRGASGIRSVTQLTARDIILPATVSGDEGDRALVGLLANEWQRGRMGRSALENSAELIQIIKSVTGKNYSDIVHKFIPHFKTESDKLGWGNTNSLSGISHSNSFEAALMVGQTAVLQNLVTWLRSQKGDTNAQRTMTKEFDSSAAQNSIEGIGGAHHGKVRDTWEELANELERAYMRTQEQLTGKQGVNNNRSLTSSEISNAYLTTAIREAIVAKFEADGIPYEQYKTILEDVFGYLLHEQRAEKYGAGRDESAELLTKLNFQRSMPAIEMASPAVANILKFMLTRSSMSTKVDTSVRFDTEVLKNTGDLLAAHEARSGLMNQNDEEFIRKNLKGVLGLSDEDVEKAIKFIAGDWESFTANTAVNDYQRSKNVVHVHTSNGGQTDFSYDKFKALFGFDVNADLQTVEQSSHKINPFLRDQSVAANLEYRTASENSFLRSSADVFNGQLNSLNELLRKTMGTDVNQSGYTAKREGEQFALEKNSHDLGINNVYTTLKELRADIKVLQELKKKAIAAYIGKDVSEVGLKAKPYKEVISERLAKGELKTVGELFNELRTYGIKRISIRQMIELTKMATESQALDLGSEENIMKLTEHKDFQLLMFLDSISGLQYENDKNQVSVIDESTRGWARNGVGQFSAGSAKGDYLFRTDGDMRTILEEYHHHLMQNNETYRVLYLANSTGNATSGAEWKRNFLKGVDVIEAGIQKNITDANAKFASTPDEVANSERAAAKAIGDMALCTLARLWVRSFDLDRRNFSFNKDVLRKEGVAEDAPASELVFSSEPAPDNKRLSKTDKSMTNMGKFYYGGFEGDYGMKNLIEFAAHAMNDSHVQSILAQQKPLVDANGREPMQAVLDTLQANGNPTIKAYASRYQKFMTKARTLLDQLVSVIKMMAKFKQVLNHSGQGTEFARKAVAGSEGDIRSKRTALEQALEATASVMPRHKGTANQLPYIGDVNALSGTSKARYTNTSGDFRADVLEQYVGRVKGTPKPPSQ